MPYCQIVAGFHKAAQQFEKSSQVCIRSAVVAYHSNASQSDYQPDMSDKAAGLLVKKRTSVMCLQVTFTKSATITLRRNYSS